jgi:hypothetical protein
MPLKFMEINNRDTLIEFLVHNMCEIWSGDQHKSCSLWFVLPKQTTGINYGAQEQSFDQIREQYHPGNTVARMARSSATPWASSSWLDSVCHLSVTTRNYSSDGLSDVSSSVAVVSSTSDMRIRSRRPSLLETTVPTDNLTWDHQILLDRNTNLSNQF